MTYDDRANVVYIAGSDNALYQYDTMGHITEKVTPGEGGLGTITSTTYDSDDRRVYIGSTGTTTIYQYDTQGNTLSPTISSSSIPTVTSTVYDPGDRFLYIGSSGSTTVYQYDVRNNVITSLESSSMIPLASAEAIQEIPEPATLGLVALGMGSVLVARLRGWRVFA
jgi:hypothetical protein